MHAVTGGAPEPVPQEDRSVVAGLDALESTAQLPPRPGPGRILVKTVLPPIVFLAALSGLWQLAVAAEIKPPYALPSPSRVWETFAAAVCDGRAVEAIWISLSPGGFGFVLSLVIGTLLGLACGGPAGCGPRSGRS